MKATWHGVVIAESDKTEVVEGTHYFPASSVKKEHLRESTTHSTCPWKGVASYYDVVVEGAVNKDAAWYYPAPKKGAEVVSERVAFWKGIELS